MVNPKRPDRVRGLPAERGFLNHVLGDVRSVRLEAGFGKQPDEEAGRTLDDNPVARVSR